ncbi:MAG: carboxymuconolactone decarboxylase family protein [Verrucomicrobia bacterium]|nr:carboxymuconolactone decarboxylase family protein [Verrucomicrobiota bacterium]
MARVGFSKIGESPFQQLLGHNSEILKQWDLLIDSFFNSATFPFEFKEELRRVLAYANGCQYCMAKAAPSENVEDARLQRAIAFSKEVAKDHTSITDAHFVPLREVFTEAEIAELCALVCFFSANHRFGAILALQPSCNVV